MGPIFFRQSWQFGSYVFNNNKKNYRFSLIMSWIDLLILSGEKGENYKKTNLIFFSLAFTFSLFFNNNNVPSN